MKHLIFSFLVLVVFFFRLSLRGSIRRGRVKESLCAQWCIDSIFAICGIIISFYLYHYTFAPYLTLRNLLLVALYLTVVLLFFFLAPSGFRLLVQKRPQGEELLLTEYRFNDTLGLVRSFFMVLLFALPIFLEVLCGNETGFSLTTTFETNQLWAGFCFAAFLILLPICLRQTFFWLKHLQTATDSGEAQQLLKYRSELHYRKRNHFL